MLGQESGPGHMAAQPVTSPVSSEKRDVAPQPVLFSPATPVLYARDSGSAAHGLLNMDDLIYRRAHPDVLFYAEEGKMQPDEKAFLRVTEPRGASNRRRCARGERVR